MGFWANLMTPKKKRIQQFEDASKKIRDGVYRRIRSQYAAGQGGGNAHLLAGAVTAEIFSRADIETEVRAFAKSNGKLIKETLGALAADGEILKAASWLVLVIDGIMRSQKKAFEGEFTGNPLENLKKLGLYPKDAREPLVEDFLMFAEEFHEASPPET